MFFGRKQELFWCF